MQQLFPFALVVFIASFTPGPNNSMLLQSGMVFGFRRSLPHIVGITLGFNVLFQSVRMGLSGLFLSFPLIPLSLKILGSLYFIYISWKILNLKSESKQEKQSEVGELPPQENIAKAPKPFGFWAAVLFQWVNVKAWLFATSVNANMPAEANLWRELSIGLIVALFTVSSTCTWTLLGKSLERIFTRLGYAKIINSILCLSLLYVVFTWWQDTLLQYFK